MWGEGEGVKYKKKGEKGRSGGGFNEYIYNHKKNNN